MLEEITSKLVSIIISHTNVEKIILFGSGARGERVSDKYVEDDVTYTYESDIDIFVIVGTSKLRDNTDLWADIRREIKDILPIDVPLSLIIETTANIRKKLLENNYFYSDIIREGKVLYDSGSFRFPTTTKIPLPKQKEIAHREYTFWMSKADDFLVDYMHNIEDGLYNNASFHLSQVTEALYFALLLTYTGYKPKSHNIEKIEDLISTFLPEIKAVFPRIKTEDKHLYDLLSRAYIDARYKKDYKITTTQLKKLHFFVLHLKDFVKEKCEEKIASLNG